MKPRLQAAPLTEEDLAIWADVDCMWSPQGLFVWTYENSLYADRRDADLMLSFMTGHRAFLVYADVGPRPSRLMRLE